LTLANLYAYKTEHFLHIVDVGLKEKHRARNKEKNVLDSNK